MPSILPILSYDVPLHDGAGSDLEKSSSILLKGELHSTSSSSSCSHQKKHPSACQELQDKKKKVHLDTHSNTHSIVSDEKGEGNVVVEPHSIGDSVKLMKKAVFAVQTTLYNGLRSSAQLQAATRLLTQSEYSDVVTERSNDKQCGYPLCSNGLKIEKKARKGRYHISLSQHKVYDLEEMRQFCSTECGVASKSYGAGLRVSHGDVLEQEKLEEIVASVRGMNLGEKMRSSPPATPVSEMVVVVHERVDEPGEPGNELGDFSGSPGEIEGYTPRKYYGNDGKPLKSAMKQSPRKHQRITWADETHAAAALADAPKQEEDSFSFVVDNRGFDEELAEGGVKERLGIAQAVVQALSEAADAASRGEVDALEAASNAGISILPPVEEPVFEEAPGAGEIVEAEVEAVAEDGDLDKAPGGEDEDLDQTDSPENIGVSRNLGKWYDAPPESFQAEVSAFGSIWTALDGWVSTETLAYIYARETGIEEFRSVNGRAIADVDESSCAEILRTISGCVSRALPEVVQALGVSLPISVIEQAVGRLLKTMNFVHAVPPFTTKSWRLISVLFLDVLSMRLEPLAAQLSKNRALLHKFVQKCGSDDSQYEEFKMLLLPLGQLSNMSGA